MFKSEKDQYLPTDLLSEYRDYLKSSDYSIPTVKNYLTDLRHLLVWITQNVGEFQFTKITEKNLRSYRSYLKERFRSKPSIAARRLSSLRKFLSWAAGKGLVTQELVRSAAKVFEEPETKGVFPTPIQLVSPPQPSAKTPALPVDLSTYKLHQKAIHHIKNTRPNWYRNYHKKEWSSTLHTVLMVLFFIAVGSLFFYSEVVRPSLDQNRDQISQKLGDVLAAVSPPFVLSFQGRLTDSSDVPVTASSDIIFTIYDAETGGTLLWTSKTWAVTPDQNGIFSVCLGNQTTSDDCLLNGVADTAFGATLFSDNAALYLQISVEGETLTPRQRISSVSYALNSATLDGIDSLSFLRSDESDNFTSGTLTINDGTTLTVNASTIGLGNASGDTLTVNATGTFNTDVNLTFGGTENLALTSDGVGGTSDSFTLSVTPSSLAGTLRGVVISQAASANTNPLDAALVIDNADNNVTVGDAISITNTGGGGTPYTNLFNSPTLDISGAGAITGATGITSSGTITFSDLITDANAVLYTTTGGIITRVVETETGSQCLLSGAGANGIPIWGACSGGSQTPWTSDIDADNWSLLDLGTNITARAGLTIATTTTGILTLDSGTTGAVNIGNNANAKTITIGNITGATAIDLNAGTGGITLDSTGTGDILINSTDTLLLNAAGVLELNSSGGVISIGNDAVAQNINLGTGTAARTIIIGNLTGATTININSGTGGINLEAAGTSTTDIIQIGQGGGGGTTPDYLALDVKSNTGDPAGGAEGYMYYNTSDNKFRCYQNTGWTDCIGTGGGGDTSGVESVQVFTSTGAGTWTKPAGITHVRVEVIGAGGGGGDPSVNSDGGGGGGAGGYASELIDVTALSSEDVTVGAGGTAGAGGSGGTGGTSAFGTSTLVQATGGSGGTGNNSGGAGGVGTLGDINLTGATGGYGAATDDIGGDGGETKFGGGGKGCNQIGSGGAGVANTGGGGGGGCDNNSVGGVGGSGIVIVWEYSGTLGSDYAEWYETEAGVEAGDLVSIGSGTLSYNSYLGSENISILEKSTAGSDLIGVVSSAPGITLGKDILDAAANPQPIALAGRIPVKISTENGPIQVGDLLTASSTPGVAMKATRAGYVIGRALTPYDSEGVGSVLTFINTHYANPTRLNGSGEIVDLEPTETATGSVLLSLDSDNNLVATVSAGTKFVWENSVGEVVAWITDAGEAVFKKVTALVGDFGKLVFGELEVKANSQAAGEAKIKEGESEIFIESDKVTEDSLIYITSTTKTNGLNLFIKEKRTEEGFVVGIERNRGDLINEATPSTTKTIKFNWLIINQQ